MTDQKKPATKPDAAVAVTTSSIEDQIRLRELKVGTIRGLGAHPYSNQVPTPTGSAMIRERHDGHDALFLEANPTETYGVAGRVVALRSMGKLSFISLRDGGGDLQIFVRKDKVGDAAFEALKQLDLGDIACAWGRAMRTKTGELSIAAGEKGATEVPRAQGQTERFGFQLLTKALRPMPLGWTGLEDVETRYRQRYVDLAVHLEVREAFRKRARLITAMRKFLDDRGYLEVETPILHKPEEAGGAAARPFATHHNTLKLDLKLRIATELHLKRLIVGGFERVYEIGRIFRNEGIDRSHNPEFTSIEFYQAYATYEDLMNLTEEMVSQLARAVTGSAIVPYQGNSIDYTSPWPRVSMLVEVAKRVLTASELEKLHAENPNRDHLLTGVLNALASLNDDVWVGLAPDADAKKKLGRVSTLGAKIAWAFEAVVEHDLPKDRPSFVIDFPLEVSPLARKRDAEPRLVDRFEAYAGGMEIANAFSELNDPRDQEARFKAQVDAAAAGDQEAMPYDQDFVRALEHGMPPTAGEGIGIDRLAMLFTDAASIRDVVLFPLLKPQTEVPDTATQSSGDAAQPAPAGSKT
jgi:lysyl-tRNA synthetase class 2